MSSQDLVDGIVQAARLLEVRDKTNTVYAELCIKSGCVYGDFQIYLPDGYKCKQYHSRVSQALTELAKHGFVADHDDLKALRNSIATLQTPKCGENKTLLILSKVEESPSK